jgi:hypothetical protein
MPMSLRRCVDETTLERLHRIPDAHDAGPHDVAVDAEGDVLLPA